MSFMKKFNIRNPFALVGSLTAILSFLFPWWQIYFPSEKGGIYVYPYTIEVTAVVPALEIGSTTSRLIAFTSILIIAILITIFGAIKKGWIGRILIGVAGLLELGIHYIFKERIQERIIEVSKHGTGMFRVPLDLPIVGETTIMGYRIITNFGLGFDLIFVAGIVTLISVIFHDIISF